MPCIVATLDMAKYEKEKIAMNSIIEQTDSICPVCKKNIKADIIDENNSAYMVKECQKHGAFKSIIAKYSWYYKGLSSLYDTLFPKGHLLSKDTFRNVTIHPTSKCNLSCSICYADSLDKIFEEPLLSDIEKTIKTIKGRKIISVLGGEPTMRRDIYQIIKLFHKAGHYVEIFTNGVKLKDLDYLRKLKKTGVNIVHLNISSLSDDSVYEKMGMGKGLLEDRLEVLSNLKKLKLNTGIIDVVIKGSTEKYINEIVTFSRKNRFIHELSIRGYSHIGKLGLTRGDELTMDELVETFARQAKGLVTLEEFYMFQRIIYILRYIFDNRSQCYVNQHILIPRHGKKIRDILPPNRMNKYINLFENMVKGNPLKAKIYFLSKLMPRMALFGKRLSLQNMLSGKMPYLSSRYYIPLEFCMFYTPYTLDLNRAKKRCSSAWWHSYAEGKYDGYCKILASTSDVNIQGKG